MLSVGVIGYGGRGAGVVRQMGVFGIPYEVAAITDPVSYTHLTLPTTPYV